MTTVDKARLDAQDMIDQLALDMGRIGSYPGDAALDVLHSASLYLAWPNEHRQDRREFGSSVEYLAGLIDLGVAPCGQ